MGEYAHLTGVRYAERHDRERPVTSLVLGDVRPGGLVLVKTSNSTYEFWAEYPDQAVGVLRGGSLTSPTRVRLAAENADTQDASAQPLRVGERARVVLLGPSGAPVRGFVTSTIAALFVRDRDLAAA